MIKSRHKYQKIDANANAAFKAVCYKAGWKISELSSNQDMFKHVDYMVHMPKHGKTFSVDIKGDKEFSATHALVEVRNVRGDDGWVFGEAQFIAFQVGEEFRLVKRADLVNILEIKGMRNKAFPSGRQVDKRECPCAAPNYYRRAGRADLVTYFEWSEIPIVVTLTW